MGCTPATSGRCAGMVGKSNFGRNGAGSALTPDSALKQTHKCDLGGVFSFGSSLSQQVGISGFGALCCGHLLSHFIAARQLPKMVAGKAPTRTALASAIKSACLMARTIELSLQRSAAKSSTTWLLNRRIRAMPVLSERRSSRFLPPRAPQRETEIPLRLERREEGPPKRTPQSS